MIWVPSAYRFLPLRPKEQAIAVALARSEETYELIERQKNQTMRLGLYADALEQRQKPKEPPFLDAQQADQLYEWLRDTITAFAEKGYILLPEYTDIQSGFKPLSRKETNYAVHDLVQFFLFVHACRTSLATGATNGGASQMLRDLQIELRELEEKEDISFEEFQKLQGIKKSIKKLQESGYEEIFQVDFILILDYAIGGRRLTVCTSTQTPLFPFPLPIRPIPCRLHRMMMSSQHPVS